MPEVQISLSNSKDLIVITIVNDKPLLAAEVSEILIEMSHSILTEPALNEPLEKEPDDGSEARPGETSVGPNSNGGNP